AVPGVAGVLQEGEMPGGFGIEQGLAGRGQHARSDARSIVAQGRRIGQQHPGSAPGQDDSRHRPDRAGAGDDDAQAFQLAHAGGLAVEAAPVEVQDWRSSPTRASAQPREKATAERRSWKVITFISTSVRGSEWIITKGASLLAAHSSASCPWL